MYVVYVRERIRSISGGDGVFGMPPDGSASMHANISNYYLFTFLVDANVYKFYFHCG